MLELGRHTITLFAGAGVDGLPVLGELHLVLHSLLGRGVRLGRASESRGLARWLTIRSQVA